MYVRGEKAQITVFIILGILILALFLIFFTFRNIIVEDKIEVAREIIEEVPSQFDPIRTFTEDCLNLVTEDALVLLGQQGGYIEPELWHGLTFNEHTPVDGDGVSFSGDGARIPYWWYNEPPNEEEAIRLASHQPTVNQMEIDAGRWVEGEIISCLNGYSAYVEQGFEVESGEPEATVNVLPGSVKVALDYPLDVTLGFANADMRHFFVELDVDLLQLYDSASLVTEAQQNFSFLEKNTLSLITLFSDTNPGQLMPMTDTTFDQVSTSLWFKSDLKEDVQELLQNYVPLLRYESSDNFFAYQYPESQYQETTQRVYDNMVLPLEGAEGLEVRFNYLDIWEPYFEMNCDGELCQPQSMSVPLTSPPFVYFGFQLYKAVYDISYPVLVSFHDPDAFNGKGYTFSIALEANIRNNRHARDGEILQPPSLAKDSLLCDKENRHSGDIKVNVRDAYTGEPISDASISFVFGEETCSIGVTDNAGVLVSPFPVAIGGVVHALSPDYLGTTAVLDTALDVGDEVVLELMPYHVVDLSVGKKKVANCGSDTCYLGAVNFGPLNKPPQEKGWLFFDMPFELDARERALVSLKRVSAVDDPFHIAATVQGDETQELRLPAGEYEVYISLVLDKEIVIPKSERCDDYIDEGMMTAFTLGFSAYPGLDKVFDDIREECYDIPKVSFDQFFSGELQMNDSVLLAIKPDRLYAADDMTLYAVGFALDDLPVKKRVIEHLNYINNIKQYSIIYQEDLQPHYD